MMGRRKDRQGQFFYSFNLDQVVPADHLVRQIDGVLDLAWVHKELAPYYSHTGRPSIDPALMIRMLIVGYVFAIRSERRLCAEVKVNLATCLPFATVIRPRCCGRAPTTSSLVVRRLALLTVSARCCCSRCDRAAQRFARASSHKRVCGRRCVTLGSRPNRQSFHRASRHCSGW
jgi:hypothetical protein